MLQFTGFLSSVFIEEVMNYKKIEIFFFSLGFSMKLIIAKLLFRIFWTGQGQPHLYVIDILFLYIFSRILQQSSNNRIRYFSESKRCHIKTGEYTSNSDSRQVTQEGPTQIINKEVNLQAAAQRRKLGTVMKGPRNPSDITLLCSRL